MSMKNLMILSCLLISILASCGGNKELKYKSYTAQNHAYTVQIPTDFSLWANLVSGYMAFERSSNRSSDAAFITIAPVDDGFASFNQSLTQNPKFQYTIYKETSNAKFAECSKGMWSAVQLGMLKTINGQEYLITVTSQVSRSYSEQIIQHIYDTMSNGVPSETIENIEPNSESSNFKTYSNPYFSISYPKDWRVVEHPDAMSDMYAGAQDESLGFTAVRFDTDASLSEIVNEAKSGAQEGGMQVTSSKNITLNSMACNKMVCEFTYQGIPIKTVAYTFKKGNTMYSIKFGTQKKYVDANTGLIEQIMSSFNIK